jgi:mono/diheme cytochrome c family protein
MTIKNARIALLLLGGSVAIVAQTPSGGDAANGKQIFMKQGCFRCHGTDGQGGAGRRLTPNPLATPAFIQYVRKPSGQMPPYTNQLTDAELTDVRAYLATIPPPKPVKDIPLLNQ